MRHGTCFLRLCLLVVAAVVAGEPSLSRAADEKPVAIGGDRQLFFDDRLLDTSRTQNVTRTLNPPQDIRRVLKPDQPWEALGFIFYASVVDDGGTLKLYHGSYDAEKKKHFMLATSTDGLHWERPSLGLKAFAGSKANNLLPLDAVEAGVFLDPHAPPEKRYRLILSLAWPDPAKAGLYVASSADGIHWNVGAERVFPFVPDSQHAGLWDEQLGKYVIFIRAWNPGRVVARVEVDDLEKPWPYDSTVPPLLVWGKDKIPTPSREVPTVLATDAQDPENVQLYTSAAVRYPFAPGVYLAFPAAYLLFTTPEWKGRALHTNDGTFDVQFAASRDGVSWTRWRQPYLAAGFCEGLDLRLVSMGQGLVRRGRWLYQYFVGWPHTHGRPVVWDRAPETRAEWMARDLGGIYCATQRVDGFVSLDAAADGSLTTQPLTFTGNRLRLNVHVAGGGRVRVALLAADGQALPGFAIADAEAINADEIDYEVRWQNGPDVSALAGQPVRLQIEMRSAKLYALQFGTAAN